MLNFICNILNPAQSCLKQMLFLKEIVFVGRKKLKHRTKGEQLCLLFTHPMLVAYSLILSLALSSDQSFIHLWP